MYNDAIMWHLCLIYIIPPEVKGQGLTSLGVRKHHFGFSPFFFSANVRGLSELNTVLHQYIRDSTTGPLTNILGSWFEGRF